MTKKGVVDSLVSVSGPRRVKALIKRYRFAVQFQAGSVLGCNKWNREAQTLYNFQRFVKWLQKLQPEVKSPTGNRNKRVLE